MYTYIHILSIHLLSDTPMQLHYICKCLSLNKENLIVCTAAYLCKHNDEYDDAVLPHEHICCIHMLIVMMSATSALHSGQGTPAPRMMWAQSRQEHRWPQCWKMTPASASQQTTHSSAGKVQAATSGPTELA